MGCTMTMMGCRAIFLGGKCHIFFCVFRETGSWHIGQFLGPEVDYNGSSGEFWRISGKKLKVNTNGAHAARHWDGEKARICVPASHAGQVFDVRVVIRSIWFLDDAWGLACDTTDFLLLEEMTVDCPF